APLRIICPSAQLISELTTRLPHRENVGWIGIADAQPLRALVNQLRQRCAPTILSRPRNPKENEYAYQNIARSKELLLNGDPSPVELQSNATFNLSGAKISTLTQALAYKGIRLSQPEKPRQRTQQNIKAVLERLQEKGIFDQAEAMVWRSIRNRDIHKKVTDFLWKALHGTHRIGHFWTNIPGLEERA
ncbi:uncharacterized protein C8Q71DRAFT_687047, partial [Rhodofomes roseus]